jgi:hypothetical protein
MPGVNTKRLSRIMVAMGLILLSSALTYSKEKIKWEELVAKHLEAIGSTEARAAAATRTMNGRATVFFRLGNTGQLSGNGGILSKGRMMRIAMNFNHPDYPGEHHAYDGKDVTVGIIRPGQRSNLSQFFYEHGNLLKEGLIGGVTSTSWCLHEVKERKPKLKYKGLKKIEGNELHDLEYKARKGGGDVRVNLYFQPETFRHVMTKYVLRVPAMMGRTPEASSRQRDRYFRVTEEFDDFLSVDALTLPHSYKLIFSYEGQNMTFLTEYLIESTEILHNATLDRQAFKVQ